MNPKPADQSVTESSASPAVEIPLVELRGHCYEDHRQIVPVLLDTMAGCGCWLLEQRVLSPTSTELRFELLLRSVFELYSGLLCSGIDLSRDSHARMKSLCTVRDHNPHHARRRRILTVRLELLFMEEQDAASNLAITAVGRA